VLTHAIAGALDLNDDGMMEQPVEQRGRDHGITEDVAPFGKAAVGREDHGALFVAGVDELEEQIAATGGNRQVADLVDDEQRTIRPLLSCSRAAIRACRPMYRCSSPIT
jgi:hypothetical protein